MKKGKKALLLVACALLLVAGSVLGTLAYLTSQDSVTNTFTVGKVAITLDEAEVNPDGTIIYIPYKSYSGSGEAVKYYAKMTDGEYVELRKSNSGWTDASGKGQTEYPEEFSGAWGSYSGGEDKIYVVNRVKENKYHLLPGHTYVKDPTVTVLTNSEECYVRMLLTINEQADLDAIFAEQGGIKLSEILTGYPLLYWELVRETKNSDDTRTYEFRYHDTVEKKSGSDTPLVALFNAIEMPGELTNEDLAKISNLKIDVVAHAIQADGFADADAAWAAFDGQHTTN